MKMLNIKQNSAQEAWKNGWRKKISVLIVVNTVISHSYSYFPLKLRSCLVIGMEIWAQPLTFNLGELGGKRGRSSHNPSSPSSSPPPDPYQLFALYPLGAIEAGCKRIKISCSFYKSSSVWVKVPCRSTLTEWDYIYKSE